MDAAPSVKFMNRPKPEYAIDIRLNNTCCTEPCAVCEEPCYPDLGWEPFLKGTYQPVCHNCFNTFQDYWFAAQGYEKCKLYATSAKDRANLENLQKEFGIPSNEPTTQKQLDDIFESDFKE
jgi:hypothetical protein